jgi:hypothetical protein
MRKASQETNWKRKEKKKKKRCSREGETFQVVSPKLRHPPALALCLTDNRTLSTSFPQALDLSGKQNFMYSSKSIMSLPVFDW